MKNSGFGLSALLVAGGAILAWAVDYQAEGIDLNQVGLILFAVGLALAVITAVLAASGRTTKVESSTAAVVDGQAVEQQRRDVVTNR